MPSSSTSCLYTLSLHDALPILAAAEFVLFLVCARPALENSAIDISPSCAPTFPNNCSSTGTLEMSTRFALPADTESAVRNRIRRRSEEHTSELQSHSDLVCRLLLPPVSTLFPYTTLFRS